MNDREDKEFYELGMEEMTLRDYFAAKFVHGALAGDNFIWTEIEEEVDAAYRIADAMLEARKYEIRHP